MLSEGQFAKHESNTEQILMSSSANTFSTSVPPSEWVTLEQARDFFPASSRRQRPVLATLKRWHAKGLRGVRLQAWRSGARWYTSESACQEFLRQLNEGTGQPGLRPKPDARRIRRCKRILEREGFLNAKKKEKAMSGLP